jgi:hypothetical protein
MPATDPSVDAYIEKSPEFAKPVLQHCSELVHTACLTVEETIKCTSIDFGNQLNNFYSSLTKNILLYFISNPLIVSANKLLNCLSALPATAMISSIFTGFKLSGSHSSVITETAAQGKPI